MSTYQVFSRETLSGFKTLAEQCRYLLSCKISATANGKALQARVGDFDLPVYCNGDEYQTIQKAVFWLKTQAANYLNAAKQQEI
ncbi:hypothetical protein NDQ71_00305 [Pseudoalteromonas sp. KG3]|uniref:hypothetical protein n=1 Tax=Pseudoalteromonas sp. KG3 TaxID=2951137 RepID=UPI002659DAF8|nr:hypothetical protein [Pseudoalteromonas sp. KG3]WKD23588.1 hypothetical protein NDQ71_00305 [Pseudoalteromonas sp. KG3]